MFGINSTRQFMAAQNALVAKYTFERLNDSDKERVVNDSTRVLQEGGFPDDVAQRRMEKLLNQPQGYLLFSVSMLRLGIFPALRGILYQDTWNIIKQNPFSILIGAEKEINKVKIMLKTKCNVDIDKEF
jgi:hypothetical protein